VGWGWVGGLGGPQAGVDALYRLCCGAVVGGPFSGGLPSVFQRSPWCDDDDYEASSPGGSPTKLKCPPEPASDDSDMAPQPTSDSEHYLHCRLCEFTGGENYKFWDVGSKPVRV
jgi:hypothetical protein